MVSIIMPAYNAEKTIKLSIESVLKQTFLDWELIIVDDGSKDKTVSAIKEYLNDSRIKLIINDKNMGVSKTRNRAIESSIYNYIAFLDSDDLWASNKLLNQINFMKTNNSKFSFTSVNYIDIEGNYFPGVYNVPNVVNYKKLLKGNVISLSSVIISKDIISNLSMENDRIHEDYLFWLKVLKKGNVANGLNEILLTYRISKTSKSGNKWKTIKMTYGVYRSLGINPISSVFYLFNALFRASLKYRRIFKKKTK